jgi:hypothetical protein
MVNEVQTQPVRRAKTARRACPALLFGVAQAGLNHAIISVRQLTAKQACCRYFRRVVWTGRRHKAGGQTDPDNQMDPEFAE